MDLDPALAALRPLGGFFVLPSAGAPPGPPPPLTTAYAAARESASQEVYENPLIFRVRKVTVSVRAPEDRVAASIAHLGLAARLWSVALACAAVYDAVPDLSGLCWDADAGAPDDLWLPEVRPLPPAVLAEQVLTTHLDPLAAALHARYRLSSTLLRGNAASALVGSARQLGRQGYPGVESLAARLLDDPRLAGTFAGGRRRSCCLYYRVPGGGLCGDCCLDRVPRSSPHGRSG